MPAIISDHELIRNITACYCIGIDLKDWDLFSRAFSDNIKVDFPEPVGQIKGVPAYRAKIQTMVASLQTQHALATQLIEITGETTAKATTYATTINFGTGKEESKSLTAWSMHQDELVKGVFDGREDWMISERKVTFQTPFSGDFPLLSM
ncbi:hypothetical protein ACJ41O_010308 [Fusarium nematophilum]